MDTSRRNFTLWAIIVVLLILGAVVVLSPDRRPASQDISFSQLLNDVDQGKVRDVVIQGPEIYGTYIDGRSFSTYAPSDPALVQRLYGKHVTITARPAQDSVPWYISLLISWLPFIALIGVWIFLSRQLRAGRLYRRRTTSDLRIDDPKLWRDRADEARAAAEQLTDPEAGRQLMDIAVRYEQLALMVVKKSDESEK